MHIYHFSHDVVIFHTCTFFKKKSGTRQMNKIFCRVQKMSYTRKEVSGQLPHEPSEEESIL